MADGFLFTLEVLDEDSRRVSVLAVFYQLGQPGHVGLDLLSFLEREVMEAEEPPVGSE